MKADRHERLRCALNTRRYAILTTVIGLAFACDEVAVNEQEKEYDSEITAIDCKVEYADFCPVGTAPIIITEQEYQQEVEAVQNGQTEHPYFQASDSCFLECDPIHPCEEGTSTLITQTTFECVPNSNTFDLGDCTVQGDELVCDDLVWSTRDYLKYYVDNNPEFEAECIGNFLDFTYVEQLVQEIASSDERLWRLPTPTEVYGLFIKGDDVSTANGESIFFPPSFSLQCNWIWTSYAKDCYDTSCNYAFGLSTGDVTASFPFDACVGLLVVRTK